MTNDFSPQKPAPDEREPRWRSVAETMRALVFLAGPDGRNLYTNGRFQDYTGVPAEALLGEGWLSVVHPEDYARAAEAWRLAVATGQPYEAEYRLRRRDGAWRWFLCCGEPERDAAGRILRWVGYAFDIDDRKAAEASRRELAAVLEATSDCVVALDRDWRITFINRRAQAQIAGGRDVRGQGLWDAFREAAGGPFWQAYRRTMDERLPATVEAFYPPLERYFRGESHPREDGGIVVFFRDVTQEHVAAARLAASEVDLHDFFENAVMPLHWVGADGTILRANRAELDLLGYTAEEYIGRHIAEFHADAPVIEDILQRLLNGEELREYAARLRCKDGTIRDVLITSNALHRDGAFIRSRCFTRDVTEQKAAEAALAEKTHTLEVLSQTGAALAAELDLERIVQRVTDAGTELSGAAFGAFFYNAVDERGEPYTIYALSGVAPQTLADFPMPRNTAVFGPTFRGEAVIRSDDITQDTRYGKNVPLNGMTAGHLPVRSYLAAPVVSRSGEVIGELYFGHPEVGVFTAQAEQVVSGIAAQAAIAIDNGRLYRAAQREIAARKAAEELQLLLAREVDHRAKNALTVVQSLLRATPAHDEAAKRFARTVAGRVAAMARAHGLLSMERWTGANLAALAHEELAPYASGEPDRVRLDGPALRLSPGVAQSLSMLLHELATNAAKYGALSLAGGRVEVAWTQDGAIDDGELRLDWRESGGPPVAEPVSGRRGFGSRLIEMMMRQLGGRADFAWHPEGLVCTVRLPARCLAGALSDTTDILPAGERGT